jgi:hypothetical protein
VLSFGTLSCKYLNLFTKFTFHFWFSFTEQLNKTFIEFILDQIETPHDVEMEDEIADTLTALILSFNLHIKDAHDNVILKVLAEKGTAKVFTEKIMMLMNRGGKVWWSMFWQLEPP